MDILTSNRVRTTFNFGEVEGLSLDLLSFLEENEVTVGDATVGLIMTAGRLLGTKDMSIEDEIKWIEALLDWAGAYVAKGSVN
jgi:hypothetical protein